MIQSCEDEADKQVPIEKQLLERTSSSISKTSVFNEASEPALKRFKISDEFSAEHTLKSLTDSLSQSSEIAIDKNIQKTVQDLTFNYVRIPSFSNLQNPSNSENLSSDKPSVESVNKNAELIGMLESTTENQKSGTMLGGIKTEITSASMESNASEITSSQKYSSKIPRTNLLLRFNESEQLPLSSISSENKSLVHVLNRSSTSVNELSGEIPKLDGKTNLYIDQSFGNIITRSNTKSPLKRSSSVLEDVSIEKLLLEFCEQILGCSNLLDFHSCNIGNKVPYSIPNDILQKPKRIKPEKLLSCSDATIRSIFHNALYRELQMLRTRNCIDVIEMHFIEDKVTNCVKNFAAWRQDIPENVLEILKSNSSLGNTEDERKFILSQFLLAKRFALPEDELAGEEEFEESGLYEKLILKGISPEKSSRKFNLSATPQPSSPKVGNEVSLPRQKSSSKSPVKPSNVTKSAQKHNSLSAVYESSIGSQQEIVERAKQEAYVMQRITDLRKEGLWSLKRLPKVQETTRIKAHWDYLLEEMTWLATDFAQERKWKKAAAKKCARMVIKYFQEKEMKVEKAERDKVARLRRLASSIAKEIRTFWANIEKLVEYKTRAYIEAKKKKALDTHLNYIVDQTEKYSTWLTEGLSKSMTPQGSISLESEYGEKLEGPEDDVEDYYPLESGSDNEETIAKEEEETMDYDEAAEIELLKQEGEIPLEDILKQYADESLENLDITKDDDDVSESSKGASDKGKTSDGDEDMYSAESECEDDEETIAAEEEKETKDDHSEELKELKDLNDISIEDLREQYQDLDDFDFSDSQSFSSSDSSDDTSSDDTASLNNLTSSFNDKEEKINDKDKEKTIDSNKSLFPKNESDPSKEITDIAATAESFQPKGNTLSTTQVCTKVPFLLKHQLREYQHIGLDWLNAMYEQNLNGILADEMGLGKTIQTIALLAHLACEKGVWGPHLIIVPTSVMLNWEIEFKKWLPAFKVLTYYGTPKERRNKRVGWTKPNMFHVCITSYKLVVQDHKSFRRKQWAYLILDEAQHIKNFKSQRWQMLLNFQSSHRLLLTGTPLQNNLMELWSLMHFLMPSVFESQKDFREWFVNPVTGMIDGNHEYNESLIRRLHKVLRPFLLRRLKAEVEKQLPKKYEHVIMCRLSKRQRYLYDDFMSQAATRETLSCGNFMSVINVLMQLRKVCNHPNLFELRPIQSPFMMTGLTYHTSSSVWGASDYDPYRNISLSALNLLLADIEMCVSAYAAHRTKTFQTPAHIIEIADSLPELPKPPAGKIKLTITSSRAPSTTSASHPRATVLPQTRLTPSPSRVVTPFNPITNSRYITPTQSHESVLTSRLIGRPEQGQQKQTGDYALQQLSGGVPVATVGNQVVASGSFTVQIPTGARMPLNIGRLVQTSSGQKHLLITPTVSTMPTDINTTSVTTTTAFIPISSGSNPPSIATATVLPQVQKIEPSSVIAPIVSTFNRPLNTLANSVTSAGGFPSHINCNKPVGRVAPLNIQPPLNIAGNSPSSATKSTFVHPISRPNPSVKKVETFPVTQSKEKVVSEYDIDSVSVQLATIRQEKLQSLGKMNNLRCSACPVYGPDLIEAVSVCKSVKHSSHGSLYYGHGYVNCLNVPYVEERPQEYWYYTKYLNYLVASPETCALRLSSAFKRFAFVVPSVSSPPIQLHTSHPPPSKLNSKKIFIEELNTKLSSTCALFYPVLSNTSSFFPEPRLIEYDCGKLQRLSSLLRDLKTDHHRVLIFTQMSKMLDILEQFLSYQGHTYLRLDGSTKIEMRQALMERFNGDPKIFCFILSTRSGGIGVNLTGADTVIFYDSDWNPTMDAQAQDRCHRIGQTRDVHIYRLISEKTVEENILKKANQKRLLGDLAIEGGNFTTAFFKKKALHELFGLSTVEIIPSDMPPVVKDSSSENPSDYSEDQLEQALGMAEEESDLNAAKVAKTEAAAELDEFDESIPLENFDRDDDDKFEKSTSNGSFKKVLDTLSPIERYALRFFESCQGSESLQELKQTEEEIEAQKCKWELERLKALTEEEQRRSRRARLINNEDPLLCYGTETFNKQVPTLNSSLKIKRSQSRDNEEEPKRRSPRIITNSTPKRSSCRSLFKTPNGLTDSTSKNQNSKINPKTNRNRYGRDHVGNRNGPLSRNGPKNNVIKNIRNRLKYNNLLKRSSFLGTNGVLSKNVGLKLRENIKNNHKIRKEATPKPFSNPSLVIRTRHALAVETQKLESEQSPEASDLKDSSEIVTNSNVLEAVALNSVLV